MSPEQQGFLVSQPVDASEQRRPASVEFQQMCTGAPAPSDDGASRLRPGDAAAPTHAGQRTGSSTRKVVPVPCCDSTSMRPLWASTRRRAMGSPRPCPVESGDLR